jgi:hypothetical protein
LKNPTTGKSEAPLPTVMRWMKMRMMEDQVLHVLSVCPPLTQRDMSLMI